MPLRVWVYAALPSVYNPSIAKLQHFITSSRVTIVVTKLASKFAPLKNVKQSSQLTYRSFFKTRKKQICTMEPE